MRIGYLASHYPAVAHAFLLREVRALRAAGVDVRTFSIHRATAEELLAVRDREEAEQTYAVLPPRPAELILTHMLALLRAPRRYLSTLTFALRRANPGLRGRSWGLFYFAEAIMLWRAARRQGVRHLHAVFADVATDVALLTTRYGGQGWTWSLAVHGPVEFYDVQLNHLAEKIGAARFAVAISNFGRSQLMTVSDHDRWSDIHVVRMGIEPQAFAVDGERSRSDPPNILCVGRLVHIKGQALLLEALARLRGSGTSCRLTLVGEGPNRGELERFADRLGVSEQVTFAGAVGQDEIRSIYRAADIFCLPSMAEGLPVVLMEAMALELPVVTTRIFGIPELVEDERTGLLVSPGRLDELVGALDRLLGDPDLCERLGREARRKVLAEFDVNQSARQLREVLNATLSCAS
jgi:glycosyltransferase involved in cell wall biosynthesis